MNRYDAEYGRSEEEQSLDSTVERLISKRGMQGVQQSFHNRFNVVVAANNLCFLQR